MDLSIQLATALLRNLQPWGEHLVEVFGGRTYAVQQEWIRSGKKIKQAVPAVWYHYHRRIQTESDFLPFTPEIAAQHLLGYRRNRLGNWEPFKVGIYPMMEGNVVQFCAADFDIHPDKNETEEEFAARRAADFPKLLLMACGIPKVARRYGVSAFIEISASGSGIHVWLFFCEPVSAAKARRLLWRILCASGVAEQMLKGFADKTKFDALFPKQDSVDKLKVGNLIYIPYFQYGLRVQNNDVVPRSVFIDADSILSNGESQCSVIPILKLSEFFSRLVRHTPAELDAALSALDADGHSEEPPDTRTVETRHQRQTAPQNGELHPGRTETRLHYRVDWRNVDWRRFLYESGIAFTENKENILRLTDGCPACGELRHQAWINGTTGYLNCFSTNCQAHSTYGGMPPTRWAALYGLKASVR